MTSGNRPHRHAIAAAWLLGCVLGFSALSGAAAAEVATLEVGKPLARFSLLVPSTRLYVRYMIKGEQRATLDIWRREIKFEEREGRRQLHIFWRWDSVTDPKFSRSEDFWFDNETFRPLTVERRLTRDGKVTISGYRYLPDRIVGMAELPDNSRKDFLQLAALAAYNFETDIELFQTLPLAAGYAVRVPFYEAGPGQAEPQYYGYRVVAADRISAADGRQIDCWVLGVVSSDPEWATTRLWFSKKTQVMIREETQLKDGSILVKSLLTGDVSSLG
jgi:hypothetical protein